MQKQRLFSIKCAICCLIHNNFAFICYVCLYENKQWCCDSEIRLGPLILPRSVYVTLKTQQLNRFWYNGYSHVDNIQCIQWILSCTFPRHAESMPGFHKFGRLWYNQPLWAARTCFRGLNLPYLSSIYYQPNSLDEYWSRACGQAAMPYYRNNKI